MGLLNFFSGSKPADQTEAPQEDAVEHHRQYCNSIAAHCKASDTVNGVKYVVNRAERNQGGCNSDDFLILGIETEEEILEEVQQQSDADRQTDSKFQCSLGG